MPFPIALRRALTALVGAVFAILCMGVGAIASPATKSGATAPVSASQQDVGVQAHASVTLGSQGDDAIPVVVQHSAAILPASWNRAVFAADSSPVATHRHTSRSTPAEVGRAPPV